MFIHRGRSCSHLALPSLRPHTEVQGTRDIQALQVPKTDVLPVWVYFQNASTQNQDLKAEAKPRNVILLSLSAGFCLYLLVLGRHCRTACRHC